MGDRDRQRRESRKGVKRETERIRDIDTERKMILWRSFNLLKPYSSR